MTGDLTTLIACFFIACSVTIIFLFLKIADLREYWVYWVEENYLWIAIGIVASTAIGGFILEFIIWKLFRF